MIEPVQASWPEPNRFDDRCGCRVGFHDSNQPQDGEDQTMVYRHGALRTRLARLHRLGILLLVPLIVILSTVILLALLGIFVTWLLVVAFLLAAVVALDVARRSMRRLARPPVAALRQRAIG